MARRCAIRETLSRCLAILENNYFLVWGLGSSSNIVYLTYDDSGATYCKEHWERSSEVMWGHG